VSYLRELATAVIAGVLACAAAPVILLIISLLFPAQVSFAEPIMRTFNPRPRPIVDYVLWVTLQDKEAVSTPFNLAAVLISWVATWFILGNWCRKLRSALLAPIVTVVLYLVYLVGYKGMPVDVSSGYMALAVALMFGSSAAGTLSTRLRPEKTFFQKLAELGVKLEPYYTNIPRLPITCPKCGVEVYSNPKYCWNCGLDLEKHYSAEKVQEG